MKNINEQLIILINHNIPVNIELENFRTKIKNITNFKYLGAWIKNSQNDEIRFLFLKDKKLTKNKNLQSDN